MTNQQAQFEGSSEGESTSVSVVIPTQNRNGELERCLMAVLQLDPAPMEIIVVDSAPEGEGARSIASKMGVRYVREDRRGASRARNRGAQEARGHIIVYTDDDAVPAVSWLGALVEEFNDSGVGLAAGKVIPAPGALELESLYEQCGFTGQGDNRIVVDRDTPRWFETVSFLPFGLGPNLAIRRSVFQRWRGFDERLGPGTFIPGQEEQRAFLQLIELGYRLVYTPAASVIHPLPLRSSAELRRRSLRRMQAWSAYLTLLIVEDRRYCREIFGYIVRKLLPLGKPHHSGMGEPISGLRCLLARLQGPALYLSSRRESED